MSLTSITALTDVFSIENNIPTNSSGLFDLSTTSITAASVFKSVSMTTTINIVAQEICAIIENDFLLKIDSSIEKLDKIINKNVEFSIELQFDADKPAIEIDNADVFALYSTLHFIRAFLNQSIAYDYSVDAAVIDLEEKTMVEVLDASAKTGTLRDKKYMEAARTSFEKVFDYMVQSIDSALAETDEQGNDLITAEMVSEIKDFTGVFTKFKNSLAGQNVVFNKQDFTPDAEAQNITVNLGSFFTNPITDIREYYRKDGMTDQEYFNSLPDNFDYTVHGLFPEITTLDELKEMFQENTNSQQTNSSN
ncbi:hypothetical protein ACFL2K_01950 [Candidatus Margulisiibacteriota bacterium]